MMQFQKGLLFLTIYLRYDVWKVALIEVLKVLGQGLEEQSYVLGLVQSCHHVAKHGPETRVVGAIKK